MSNKLALMLTCGVLMASFATQAQAFPPMSVPAQSAAPKTILVRDLCGLGFHRDPYGNCTRNGTVYAPVVVAPPVVVVPQYAPPPAVAVCPYGYYLGPYGRCLPY